ncbi:MAG: hypothetical protein K6F82_03085 [Sphaerochaetaceae bacterium]|nr:hypothetical protein [Sphaerochaetaceae bacterium]
MNYITVQAKTYEEALKKARHQYGDRLRILSRKDITKPGFMGLGHVVSCEITCFLTGEEEKPVSSIIPEEKEDTKLIKTFENEAKTPNPDDLRKATVPEEETTVEEAIEQEEKTVNKEAISEIEALLEDVKQILIKNDFTSYYIKFLMDKVKEQAMRALPDVPSKSDIQTAVLDQIAGSLKIIKETASSRITAFIGPEGSGKSTTLGKVSLMLVKNQGCKVGVINLHGEGTPSDLTQRICQAGKIPYFEASDASSLKAAIQSLNDVEYIFIDTEGQKLSQSSSDRAMVSALKDCGEEIRYVLVLSSAMKYSDMDASSVLFYPFEISSMAVTCTDKTLTIGNAVSFSYEKKIPMEFIAYGRGIPKDFKSIAVSDVITRIKGFTRSLFSS